MRTLPGLLAAIFMSISGPAWGQFDSGSDGSDGAFNPQSDVVVQLGRAKAGAWHTPGDGDGVYDANKWAVVFKYTSVNIPEGVTVSFLNHPSGAPVVWLVEGDVTIAGVVNLDGADGVQIPARYAEPGPGGFAGGGPLQSGFGDSSAGFGPGGGQLDTSNPHSGAYGTAGSGGAPAYGSDTVFPLIGGSGGGARRLSGSIGGGAGGGGFSSRPPRLSF